VLLDDVVQQRAERVVLHAVEPAHELGPHLVHGPRRAADAFFFTETVGGVAVGQDAPDFLEDDFHPALVDIRAPLRLHEFTRVELLLDQLDVLEHLRANLAGRVLQEQLEILVAAAARAGILAAAEEESPAGEVGGEFGDPRQPGHHRGSVRKLNEPRSSH
jgi:hypothetical protein